MAAFEKSLEKLGGRKKGTRNKGTDSIKTLLNTLLPEEDLAKLWKKKLYSKNLHVAMKAFEMAMQYMFASEELAPPIKIDISAIPKFRVKA
jgi:ubiquinone biosynthesis protein UbiJ